MTPRHRGTTAPRYHATIAIWAPKGGTGKTTVTAGLGAALAALGADVRLLDCDPQGDLSAALGGRTTPPEVVAVPNPRHLTSYLKPGAVNLLDCPPGVTDAALRALEACDLFLAPIGPGYFSLLSAAALVERAEALPNPPGLLFLRSMTDRTIACRAVADELRAAYPRHLARTEIPRCAALERAHAAHLTALEYEEGNHKGAAAFRALAREVLKRGES